MSLNRNQVKKYLASFDFTSLFIEELGWDYIEISPIYLTVNEANFTLEAIAEKRGLIVYRCLAETGNLPQHSMRRKIDHEITNYSREHLIIYTNA